MSNGAVETGGYPVVVDPGAVISNLDELAAQSGGRFAGAKRLAWSEDWLAAREWLTGKLRDAGLEPRRDAAGNLWAELPGERPGAIIIGSHIDAVPNGGWLDGALGVLSALEVIRQLAAADAPPPVTIRFVDWADEEGARFGRSLLGSSAVAGTLDADDVRDLQDADGVALVDALAACGVDLDRAGEAAGSLDDALAYLELHIEQGPVLLEAGELACAVAGTVGVERHLITFTGQAAHAGSTPMAVRQDSLAAAARATLEIRESAIRHGGVGTVGKLSSSPGVITAVAGSTEMLLDQRHLQPKELEAMLIEAVEAAERAAEEFGCTVEITNIFTADPTPFDPDLVIAARSAVVTSGGHDIAAIPSGPLHDATEIGRIVPTGMIFAQSDPPISHAQVEDSSEAALTVAINAYGRLVSYVLAATLL